HTVRFVPLGVRGSTPAPGSEFVRYGGHTSCVAVYADGADVPDLLLDAGTGLRMLPALLAGAAFKGRIVLSHLHWDHVQGLPFCPSVDNPRAQVSLYVPVENPDTDPEGLLAQGFSPPNFPIGPDGLLGEWQFCPLLPGAIDDTVTVATVAHKGGTAVGIRVTLDGAVLAYLPDHALHDETPAAARADAERLAAGADVLLHDGQFVAAEHSTARAYGHATIETVLEFADRCGVGALVLTHHGPARTDDQLDELAGRFHRTPQGRPVSFAQQNTSIEVTARSPVQGRRQVG
ncbi:MAG: MBL fold metallo-hydrolase, partial [Pseudonocardiales bacterium]